MRHAPPIDLIRREIRAGICRHCRYRSRRGECVAPNVARPCEQRCAIFNTLPRVHEIGEYLDPSVKSYASALQRLYSELCASPGPDCDLRPLQKYQQRAIEILDPLLSRTA